MLIYAKAFMRSWATIAALKGVKSIPKNKATNEV